jgi:hypothetical protein
MIYTLSKLLNAYKFATTNELVYIDDVQCLEDSFTYLTKEKKLSHTHM